MRATVHTIEAVIGTLILLVGVMSIYPISQGEELHLSENGYNCLKYLDDGGQLRNYVYNALTTDLNTSLKDCLPQATGYTFKICATMDCSDTVPTDRSVFLSSYILSGQKNYDPKIINLWVWMK